MPCGWHDPCLSIMRARSRGYSQDAPPVDGVDAGVWLHRFSTPIFDLSTFVVYRRSVRWVGEEEVGGKWGTLSLYVVISVVWCGFSPAPCEKRGFRGQKSVAISMVVGQGANRGQSE